MMAKLDAMRFAGTVNKSAISWGSHHAKPGVTLKELDAIIEDYILKTGCKPAFKGYRNYPATACLSVNDVAVHGIPNEYSLRDGDLLTIDVGAICDGWYVDSARSFLIGTSKSSRSESRLKLIEAAEMILEAELSVLSSGCTYMQLIDAADRKSSMLGVNIMPQWQGHHIGNTVHIEPSIPNTLPTHVGSTKLALLQRQYRNMTFKAGDTICLEPVVTFGTVETTIDSDGWTIRSRDGSDVAHTERCLLVTEQGYELLS
jgi:methionyl aminopeptidase